MRFFDDAEIAQLLKRICDMQSEGPVPAAQPYAAKLVAAFGISHAPSAGVVVGCHEG
jgi:hypothetical protein